MSALSPISASVALYVSNSVLGLVLLITCSMVIDDGHTGGLSLISLTNMVN